MRSFRTVHPLQTRRRRSRLSLALFLVLVFLGIRLFNSSSLNFPHHPLSRQPPLAPIIPVVGEESAGSSYHLLGIRVRRNGTSLDLGDRRTQLPASLLWHFFPAELIIPSCLTEPPPLPSPAEPAARKPIPVRDDWPGFYGAPWIARVDGNLIALLHVYAPRHAALPVEPPEFQIYTHYSGQQTNPAFSAPAPATFTRGSKAVLYRVFTGGPVRCLDLVVKNGENTGIGHLYYQRYHHYYERDAIFQIQP